MARTQLGGFQVRDDDFLLQSEGDTISGTLSARIDLKPDSLLDLADTPSSYDTDKYLKSTVSGTEWATVSGGGSSDTSASVTTGTVSSFALTSVPDGWLECDGSSLSRSTYADLYAAIGVTYGNVDGNTFNIPDYRGKFLRSWDHGAAVDPDRATRTDRGDGTGGDVVGSKQAEGFKSHTHVEVSPTGAGSIGATGIYATAQFDNTGATGGNETRPININVLVCIKY